MVSRIFTVFAAVFLVGAFALAAQAPLDLSLVQGLSQLSPEFAEHLRRVVVGHFGNPFWLAIVVPCLVRPVWLLPALLGFICAGLAGSFRARPSPNTRRRSL